MRLAPADLQSMAPLSDHELVDRIVAGDLAVFELLMRRHNQRLFRVARSIVRNDQDAEEVVQETYLRAYRNLARFEGRSSVVTWLSRIAFHEALRRKRRQRLARVAASSDVFEVLAMSSPSTHNTGSRDEGDPLVHAEDCQLAVAALDALPTLTRSVVMMRLVEGLSVRETAESLRISEANVKILLHRGRHMLSEAFEPHALPAIRKQFSFAAERCDRIVAGVFQRLDEAN